MQMVTSQIVTLAIGILATSIFSCRANTQHSTHERVDGCLAKGNACSRPRHILRVVARRRRPLQTSMVSVCFGVRYQKHGRRSKDDAKEHHVQLVVAAPDLLEAYRIAKLTCEGRGYERFLIFNVQASEARWMSVAGTRNSTVGMSRSG